jgi:hypothetical protein
MACLLRHDGECLEAKCGWRKCFLFPNPGLPPRAVGFVTFLAGLCVMVGSNTFRTID